ncbi:MAG: carboxypeptidase-like regulatory domain-containing protein [Acidobacteriota bacterium]
MRSMQKFLTLVVTAGLIFATVGTTAAQPKKQKDDINARQAEGTVVDSNQAPVPKAVVQLKDLRTNAIRSFVTDANGGYRFAGLRADVDYELKATFMGLSSDTKHLTIYDTRKLARVVLELKK